MDKKPRSTEEILKELEELSSTRGYMHVVAEITSRDLFLGVDEAATVNWRERVSYQELTLLLGLTLKSAPLSYDELSKEDIEELIKVTRALLKELHWSYSSEFPKLMGQLSQESGGIEKVQSLSEEEKDAHFKKLFGSGTSMVEATFYADSGSYDFQFLEMAPRLYQFDKDWLDKRGMNFETASRIYSSLKKFMEGVHFGRSDPKFLKMFGEKEPALRAIDEFAFSKADMLRAINIDKKAQKISSAELDKFLELFSAKPEDQFDSFSGPGDLNIVDIRPIIEISEDVYFIPISFNIAEAIYQSPAYWMYGDKEYVDKIAENRGRANEQITYEYFKEIFGDLAFKSLKVVKGKKTLTDIDVMGVIGNVAIVAQNKSKKMTKEALKGNEEILKSDFKKAIQSAYDQGIQSRDILLAEEDYKFIDEEGNEVTLPHGIEHVYILCVTADVYPAALHQLKVYLEKDKDQPWPLALSLFDLDIIATYLKDPYEFAFYVKQRTELTDVTEAGGEMAYLGFHIRLSGLFKPDNADMFMIDQDYAQLVDADYMYRKGVLPKLDKKHPLESDWSNETFDQLLLELKSNVSDPRLTDIVFYLKSIPPNVVDGFMDFVLQTRAKAKKDGLPHNVSMPITEDGQPWGGITYVTGNTMQDITEKLNRIVQVNKYRNKSKQWLGIGAITGQKELATSVLFGSEAWEQSDDMDKLVASYDKTGKKIEVNLSAVNKKRSNNIKVNKSKTKKKSTKAKKKAERQARKKGRRSKKRK